jgi:acetolactate synthase regulatory subunit
MATHHELVTTAARLRVVVIDAVGLQRVLTMLTGRNHAFTRLEAEETNQGRWTVTVQVAAPSHQIDLMTLRLNRLPSVLTVDVTSSGQLAATA